MRRRWDVIADLVRQSGLRIGAEIGTAEGRFVAGLLRQCPDVLLWCVDDYAPGYKTWMGTEWTAEDQARNRATFDAVRKEFGLRVTHLPMKSLHAASWLPGCALDFVFIDADHSFEAVRDDIAAWCRVVRPGGYVTGHDYDHNKFPGVVRAVDDAFPDAVIGEDFTWMAKL
jgi:hypothetical protein